MVGEMSSQARTLRLFEAAFSSRLSSVPGQVCSPKEIEKELTCRFVVTHFWALLGLPSGICAGEAPVGVASFDRVLKALAESVGCAHVAFGVAVWDFRS